MKTDFKKSVGDKIRNYRTNLKISQQHLADFVGLSRVQIVSLEAGRTGTNFESLWKICNALNCTPNDLFPEQQPAILKETEVDKTVMVPTIVKVKKYSLQEQSKRKSKPNSTPQSNGAIATETK